MHIKFSQLGSDEKKVIKVFGQFQLENVIEINCVKKNQEPVSLFYIGLFPLPVTSH